METNDNLPYALTSEEVKDFTTEYVEGASADFIVFIQSLGDKAQLHSIDGKARWVVTKEDGSQVIYRPQETNGKMAI